MVALPSYTKIHSINSPSLRVVEFAGFLSIYRYHVGGLDSSVSPYLYGKRGSYFLINPGKVMPIFRKGVSFSHAVGFFLGSVSLADSAKRRVGSFLKQALFDFVSFCKNLNRKYTKKKSLFGYFTSLSAFRYWKSPFRVGYYARWVPGAFTNFPNVLKFYVKKSAPKLVVYRHRISRNLQAWFLPKWFPSFAGVFDMLSVAPAIRETARLGVPNIAVGSIPVRSITISEITYPIVGYPTAGAGAVVYEGVAQNYYKGVTTRLNEFIDQVYRKLIVKEKQVFPDAFRFNRERYYQIFSDEDYERLIANKPTYAKYKKERDKRLAEEREKKKILARIRHFKKEEEIWVKNNPNNPYAHLRPTPVQKAVIFQPHFNSLGMPGQPRKDELARREAFYDRLKAKNTFTDDELGSRNTLKHGLFVDYFDNDNYLKPGKTLWNKTVGRGNEDFISKMFMRSSPDKRPDLIDPNVHFGQYAPFTPGWDPSILDQQHEVVSTMSKRKLRNYKRNLRRKRNRDKHGEETSQ